MFNFLKKKPANQESLDLPPPPAPESAMQPAEVRIVHDLPEMAQLPDEATGSAPEPVEEPVAELPMEPVEEPVVEHDEAPLPVYTVPAKGGRGEPRFVAVNDYQEVLSSINYVRGKLGEAEELVRKLNEIKAVEEKSFEAWRNQLEDVQRKLAYVENVVFEAGV
jgi:hypothetical protein